MPFRGSRKIVRHLGYQVQRQPIPGAAEPGANSPRGNRYSIIAAVLIGLGVVLVWAGGAFLSLWTHDPRRTDAALMQKANEMSTGRIYSGTDVGEACEQKLFDNQTGRVTPLAKPCDSTGIDLNGKQPYQGTVRRLDSISKSFSGRDR
jgi:hypothetical protein